MRRALLTIALAAAALSAAAPAPAAVVPATVRVVDCSFERHEAAFHARMRLVEGASRMAMRFTLLQETGGARAEAIKAPVLRRWHRSTPGVRSFGYRQGFRNLPENATHRVRVDFRWYSASGEEIARARRRSARCRQFVALPNLTIRLIGVAPTASPGVMRYRAAVTNTGKGAASAVPVRLTVDRDVVDTVSVASLAPGEERWVAIRGPECRRLARLEVDPGLAIAETADDDNSFELACAALRNAG
jgi:CARDB